MSVLLLLVVGFSGRYDDLWTDATRWQVGEDVEVVALARERFIEEGEEALPFLMEKLGAETTLEKRALWAIIPAIGDLFIEPLMAEVLDGDGERLTNGIDLLIRMEVEAVVDQVVLRWPEGAFPTTAPGRMAVKGIGIFGRVDLVPRIILGAVDCGRDGLAAVQALGKLPTERSGQTLGALVDGDCAMLRYGAEVALAHLGRLDWIPQEGRGRFRVLGRMSEAGPLLVDALEHADWRIQLEGVRGLAKSEWEGSMEALLRWKGAEHPAVRSARKSALGD
ncbi:hypothetical protein H8D30_07030 [bacterium]|nr:hypothetical protein [bacterium]